MNTSAESLVKQTVTSLDDIEIPAVLHESISKHQSDLVTLVSSLLDGGTDEAMIRQSIEVIFSSYKTELCRTIMVLREESDNE